ncbi:hypothetical protein E2542_SST13281 [Spatholobus suberectus]|nr:hypothetical protein E2542_SST13281 [Spatholobus suberectus]
MENYSSQSGSKVTASSSNRNMNYCFCGVPCKIQTSGTSRNPVDEGDDKEQVLALVVAQKLDLMHLHDIVEKMYHDLNAISVKVEKISEDLNVANRMVETMN